MRKLFVVLLGVTVLFHGCSENDQSTTYLPIENVYGTHFSLDNFEDPFVKNNLNIDWDRYVSRQGENGREIREYRTWSDAKQVLNEGDRELGLKYTVMASKERESKIWDYTILKYTGGDIRSLQNVSFFEKNNFSGPLYFYDIKGRTTKIEGYTNGELVSTFTDVEKGFVTASSKDPEISCGLGDGDCSGGGSGGGWRTVVVKHYTDWYNVRSNGVREYSHSSTDGYTLERIWVPSGGGAGPRHSHVPGGHGSSGVNVHPFEIILDKSFVGTKAECVYDKLSKLNGNLFKKTIGKFIDDPKYDLTFKVGKCSTSDDACTNSNDFNNMIITIEDVNTNPLQLAQYILHEAIHAELHRYVSRFKAGVDPNNRARLFQLYAYYKNKEKPGNIQHIYMTENYINPIASALRQLDGNKYPLDYYRAFAWDGLRVWDANNLLSMEENFKYENYRNITVNNTKISCK